MKIMTNDKFIIPLHFTLSQALELLYSIGNNQYENLKNGLEMCRTSQDYRRLPKLFKALDDLLLYVNNGLKKVSKKFDLKNGLKGLMEEEPKYRHMIEDFQLLGHDVRILRRESYELVNYAPEDERKKLLDSSSFASMNSKSGSSSLLKSQISQIWKKNSTRGKESNNAWDEDEYIIQEAKRIRRNRKLLEQKKAEEDEQKRMEQKRCEEALEEQRQKLLELEIKQQVDSQVTEKLEDEKEKGRQMKLETEKKLIKLEAQIAKEELKSRKKEERQKLALLEKEEKLQELGAKMKMGHDIQIQNGKHHEVIEPKKTIKIKSSNKESSLLQKNLTNESNIEKVKEPRITVPLPPSSSDLRQSNIGSAAQNAWRTFNSELSQKRPTGPSSTTKVKGVATNPHTKKVSSDALKDKYEYTKPVIRKTNVRTAQKSETSSRFRKSLDAPHKDTRSSKGINFHEGPRKMNNDSSKSRSLPTSPVLTQSSIPCNDGSAFTNRSIDQLNPVPGADAAACEQILNEIMVTDEKIYWEDIAGLTNAKNSLKEAVVYPFLRPDLFKGLREPIRGMLLFGPPGTGKTMIAKAVATESKSTFFCISASSLLSKYLGESEKSVRALFYVAKKMAPSIIFIDEIDSLLGNRSDGENEASRRVKTELLIQWSSLSSATTQESHGYDTRVLLLAATNLPWTIDEAARRRFSRRLYIPLPDFETRQYHLTKLLSKQKHSLTESEIIEVATLTAGYSGSDITALAKEAVMEPIRDLGEKLIDIDLNNIRGVTILDFKNAMKTVKKSVSVDSLAHYEKWALEYGSVGS
ncbi:hypothetical protein KAFR_0E00920 [Kazachstania africana CBS 2517]|uniref:AAA+ ATPase domain-containing protein n=1 Tax=Kazachstania africana (strain ATCC 22294 / BCRC 22015 / CBS 2517 / CECT 1963 / NBRC 1671 / NRRL Y-8276) TaxID=1071382 RepID=H2AV46_KAZAF|nr:hypothetical protein KAFR_0E00920 [Kazachstania africana CBS 2517]CCF58246.1 hypothetical protein KAFR_0E00920 [Kazachstania africana CBS 2517]